MISAENESNMALDHDKEAPPASNDKRKAGPKYGLILIMILIVGLVSGGGVYLWRQEKIDDLREVRDELKARAVSLGTKIKDLEKEVVSLKKDQDKDQEGQKVSIENWETYKNKDYDFEFQHPKGWPLFDELPPVGEEGTAGQRLQVSNKNLPEDPCLKVYVNPMGFGLPVPDYEYSISLQDGQVNIDEKESVLPKNGVGPTNKDGDTVVLSTLETENNRFIFLFSQNQCGRKYRGVFDKMLKSFRIN